ADGPAVEPAAAGGEEARIEARRPEAVLVELAHGGATGRQAAHRDLLLLAGEVGKPQRKPAGPLPGDNVDRAAIARLRPPPAASGGAGERGDDVISGIDGGRAKLVEIGLGVVGRPEDDALRAGWRADGHGRHAAAGKRCEIAERPGGAEQAA